SVVLLPSVVRAPLAPCFLPSLPFSGFPQLMFAPWNSSCSKVLPAIKMPPKPHRVKLQPVRRAWSTR
ncbi:hypothetical protein, partial [Variovorax sp. CF313]|uniref:hypothetical protein n=1 Tax=Variovorax sp. CF313 TaxID=1144315 RepID=UPI001ED91766